MDAYVAKVTNIQHKYSGKMKGCLTDIKLEESGWTLRIPFLNFCMNRSEADIKQLIDWIDEDPHRICFLNMPSHELINLPAEVQRALVQQCGQVRKEYQQKIDTP